MTADTISTKDMSEADWLKLRHTGIGGSDGATVMGLNQYKTPYELYPEKTGQIEADDLSDNAAVHFGNVLEDVVATEYAERTGQKVTRSNMFYRDKEFDFLIANIDRKVVGAKKILECKTAGQYMSDQWGPGNKDGELDDTVPMPYLIQCTHYMAVLEVEECDLAVLIGGRDLRIYTIRFDHDLWHTLLDAYVKFWTCVETRTPPEFDGRHPAAGKMLDKLHPTIDSKIVEIGEEGDTWAKVLESAQTAVSTYTKVIDGCKNHLRMLQGNAHVALTPGGRMYEAKVVKRAGYVVKPSEVRTYAAVNGEKSKIKLIAKYENTVVIEGETA
jgi:putative phage-type endonuclease